MNDQRLGRCRVQVQSRLWKCFAAELTAGRLRVALRHGAGDEMTRPEGTLGGDETVRKRQGIGQGDQ